MRRDGAYFLLRSSRNVRNFVTTYVIYMYGDNSAKSLHTLVTTALNQLVLKLPNRKGVQLMVTPALPSITSDPISLAFGPASPTGSRHLVKHVLLQHFFPG